MEQYSDEQLVRLYVETQKNAYFERLYERYSNKVYRKCLTFTKDPLQAEDLTHDIFLKLVLKLSHFKEQAKFSTWLYSITYNQCIDHVRAPHRRTELYMDEGWERLEVDTDEGAAEIAEMEAQKLKQALEALDPTEQSLLFMKYQDNISIREIAELAKTTESAVKMRLKRTREKLRKHYLESGLIWFLIALKAALAIRWPFR